MGQRKLSIGMNGGRVGARGGRPSPSGGQFVVRIGALGTSRLVQERFAPTIKEGAR
jgi:hypothetical protein